MFSWLIPLRFITYHNVLSMLDILLQCTIRMWLMGLVIKYNLLTLLFTTVPNTHTIWRVLSLTTLRYRNNIGICLEAVIVWFIMRLLQSSNVMFTLFYPFCDVSHIDHARVVYLPFQQTCYKSYCISIYVHCRAAQRLCLHSHCSCLQLNTFKPRCKNNYHPTKRARCED